MAIRGVLMSKIEWLAAKAIRALDDSADAPVEVQALLDAIDERLEEAENALADDR